MLGLVAEGVVCGSLHGYPIDSHPVTSLFASGLLTYLVYTAGTTRWTYTVAFDPSNVDQ